MKFFANNAANALINSWLSPSARGSFRVDDVEHDDRRDRRQAGVEGDERREVVGERGPAELEHLRPAGVVTDPVPAEALEAQFLIERVRREVGDGGGGNDLTTVGHRTESGGAVHGVAHEVAVPSAYLTGIERDPHPELDAARPPRLRERTLHRCRGAHRAGDGREDDEVAVALAARLHHVAAVPRCRPGNDRIEGVEHVGHVRGMIAPEA